MITLWGPATSQNFARQQGNWQASYGFSDFTNFQGCQSVFHGDNLSSQIAKHGRHDDCVAAIINGAAITSKCTVGVPTSTEVLLSWTGTPAALFGYAEIYSGNIPAHFLSSSTTGEKTTGFQPIIQYSASGGASSGADPLNAVVAEGEWGRGVCVDAQNIQHHFTFQMRDDRADTRADTWLFNDCLGSNLRDSGSPGSMYRRGVTTTTPTSYTLANSSSTGAQNFMICTLGLDNNGVEMFISADPGDGSTVAHNTTFDPGVVQVISKSETAMNTLRWADNFGCCGTGVVTSDGQTQMVGYSLQNDLNTSACFGWASDSKAFEVRNPTTGVVISSGTVTIRAGGYDINYDPGGVAGQISAFIAIQATVPTGGVGPTPSITQLTPTFLADGQPNGSITGTDFEAEGAGSKVEVTDGSTTVEATYAAWSDTSITGITYNTVGINLGSVSVLVTNNSGNTSAPAAASHKATLPSTGPVTSAQMNERIDRPATQTLNPTRDSDFTAYVSNTAIAESVTIPSPGVS